MSDGARVLTTAEVESWQVALGRRWGARIGPRGHEVVIEGDRILATTRALEKLEEGLKLWHGLPPDERAMVAIKNAWELWRNAVAELDSARFARDRYANTIGLIESAIGFSGANPVEETVERVRRLKAELDSVVARAEKAEAERDAARGEARAHRAALDDATASCHGLGCGRCEDCVSMQRARAELAESERDEARGEARAHRAALDDAS